MCSQETCRPPARKRALRPGTGNSGAGPSTLAPHSTPSREPPAEPLPQSGARAIASARCPVIGALSHTAILADPRVAPYSMFRHNVRP